MELWEYQVIHLNVEGSAAASPPQPPPEAPPAAPAEAAAAQAQPVFSREYLEKEFPGFYAAPGQSASARSEHPAQQLRGFLNGLGRQGWLLVGFYPVGQLTMMVFRRPLATQLDRAVSGDTAVAGKTAVAGETAVPGERLAGVEPAVAGSSALGESKAGAAGAVDGLASSATPDGVVAAGGATSGPPCSEPPEPVAPADLLARLEALEQRLEGGSPAQPPRAPGRPPVAAAQSSGGGAAAPVWESLHDGDRLSREQLDQLAQPTCSTAEAARALGFRSAASLLNPATRLGYPLGLVKCGRGGRLAVYVGSRRSERGGRDQRCWVVLPPCS